MSDTYTDRQRYRADAARRAEGFPPALPGDAYALWALGELAKRMGFGDAVSDGITDEVDRQYFDSFTDVDRELAWDDLADTVRCSDDKLVEMVLLAIKRHQRETAERAESVTRGQAIAAAMGLSL